MILNYICIKRRKLWEKWEILSRKMCIFSHFFSKKYINFPHIFSQITASVSFLPLLEEPVSFDVLIYTGKDTQAPEDWTESEAHLIQDAETVRMKQNFKRF